MVSDPTFDAFYPAALAATTVDQVKSILQQANQYCHNSNGWYLAEPIEF